VRKSRFNEEQIIAILKEGEAGIGPDELCRRHGITRGSLYRWKAKYGGMEVSEARRLRQLEEENRGHQHFVLGLLTLRRNEVVIRLQHGHHAGAQQALGEMAAELSRIIEAEAASLCLSACIRYCYETDIPEQALSSVVQIGCCALDHALHATDQRGWPNVFQQCQELAMRLRERHPVQAAAILRAYKKLALARFAQGRKVAADIDRVLEKLGE